MYCLAGLQVLTAVPQEMQLIQPQQAQTQEKQEQQIPQHQVMYQYYQVRLVFSLFFFLIQKI